jgi:hypothetical protein
MNKLARKLGPIRGTGLVAAAVAAAVALPLTASTMASATAAPSGTRVTTVNSGSSAGLPSGTSGSPAAAQTRISDFYGTYIDAVSTEGTQKLRNELRAFYLTKELRNRLATWESRNGADGVLRAQNVPGSWSVTPDGSGAGHTWAVVKLTWGDGSTTRLHVQADLATKKVSDIKPLG